MTPTRREHESDRQKQERDARREAIYQFVKANPGEGRQPPTLVSVRLRLGSDLAEP